MIKYRMVDKGIHSFNKIGEHIFNVRSKSYYMLHDGCS